MRCSRLDARPLCLLAMGLLLAVMVPQSPGQLIAPPAEPAAQPAAEGDTPPAETPPKVEIPEAMRSPRAVLQAFIARMRANDKKGAAELLDLSAVNSAAGTSRGPDLAFKLYAVLQRLVRLPTEEGADVGDALNASPFILVPDEKAEEPWSIASWTEASVGDKEDKEAERIVIGPGKEGRWKFTSQTVSEIDSLYEATENQEVIAAPTGGDEPTETFEVTLRRAFPESLRKTYFLLPTYQWLLLLALAPIGRVIEKISRIVLTWIGDRLLERFDPKFKEEHETTKRVWRPVGRFANAATWVVGADLIGLPLGVTDILSVVLRLVAVFAAVFAIFGIFDLVAGYFSRRAKRRQRKFDDLVVPLANTTAKIFITLGGIIAAIAAFNDELPATLIGGLGIGGIAIALASQETLSNFIGSITLLFDRPFEVGDWIIVDGIEGEVESLGFRSTRIRTGPNSQVTLPNNKLASTSVDNLGRRRYRRYFGKLGLEYGTSPERIEAFCEGIRELIRRHPHTRKDFYAAYFNDFGAASLDVLVVAFFEAPDWPTELRERHRLLADIMRLAESIGVSFAFPTQTLHLHRGEAPTTPPTMAEDSPDQFGARSAAEIAGELANYQDRPGKVKFTGPTSLD